MRCNMPFLVMRCRWCQCQHHMLLMASSMKPLHFPGQDNLNEVHYDFFGHVMPFASVSPDAKWHCQCHHSFLRSKQSEWGATWLLCSWDAIGAGIIIIMLITWSVTLLHLLGQYDQNERQHDFFGVMKPLELAWVSHCQWQHSIPWVKITKMRLNVTLFVT